MSFISNIRCEITFTAIDLLLLHMNSSEMCTTIQDTFVKYEVYEHNIELSRCRLH